MDELIEKKKSERLQQEAILENSLRDDPNNKSEKAEAITKTKPTELLESLRNSKLTAVEVLKAFQLKALEVTKKTNCITEFIPEAEQWAKECDKVPVKDRRALHGLPVSLKENIDVKGMDSTMGLAKYLDHPASSHSAMVTVLLENGAVPFCKTNVPQTLLSSGCSNPLFGVTTNPFDSNRTSGGSSGGEGALIAGGGSVLGIGTDIGGSIRIPASHCGCVGFKPTFHRLSSVGFKKAVEGMVGVTSCPGFLGRDVSTVEIGMKALTKDRRLNFLDPSVVPLAWNENVARDEKLTFGYYDEINLVPATPGVKRAVGEAKLALEKAGHKVIPFKPPGNMYDICEEIYALMGADEGNTIIKLLDNENIDPLNVDIYKLLKCPLSIRAKIKRDFESKGDMSAIAIQDKYFSSIELWKGLARRDDYVREFSKAIQDEQIDLILGPVLPFPAPLHQAMAFGNACYIYNLLYNYCDFPSGTVPVTTQSEEDQKLLEEYPEDTLHNRRIKESTRGAHGLPIGVQIVGLRWQDELVFRGMAELERSLKEA